MLDAIPYDALLAIHLLAIAIFVAGLAITAASLPSLSRASMTEAAQEELRRVRSINDAITSPALLVLWLCGLGMAVQAGWYAAGWLQVKVVLVVVLSALHGFQTRQLRRLSRGRPVRPVRYRVLILIGGAVIAIGILVIAKPF